MAKKPIIIKTKNKSIFLALIVSILFVSIGIYMISNPNALKSIKYNPIFVEFFGYIGIIFFGIGIIYFVYKLFDKKPGLIIDENGIFNNSSIISKHTISWNELNAAGITKMEKQKIIFLYFKDDEDFILKFNFIEKLLMRINLKIYGSRIGISTLTLDYNADKLQRQIQYRIKNWA